MEDGSKWIPMRMAIEKENVEILTPLLQNGANPNFCKKDYFSSLNKAIVSNKLEIVALIVENGNSTDI